jgi:3-oxoacyl-[acyl-carrier protein] reductase
MKHALITGSSGTLGKAIAQTLAADGYHIYAHAHAAPEKAEACVEAIRASGGSASLVICDITNYAETKAALEELLQKAPIQIIVNNAGIHEDVPLAGMSLEQWQRVTRVSVDGFFNVVQPLLMPMLATRWGRVISISSVTALMGNKGQVNYGAAKAALHGATKSFSREYASRGITANVVVPGVIESPAVAQLLEDKTALRQMIPAGKAGAPEDVANLVSFLASEKAGYISGQVIAVDGGMS